MIIKTCTPTGRKIDIATASIDAGIDRILDSGGIIGRAVANRAVILDAEDE